MTQGASSLPQRYPLVAAGVLVLGVLLAYGPVFSAQFVWDDFDFIVRNDTLRSWEGLARLWLEPGAVTQYYPLVFTSLWLEFQLYGLEPMGYHVTNVLLHAANTILVWRILARLSVPGAWLAAAIFALHPVHVESVAWVTERKNVLSGLFYLVALRVYLRFDAKREPWAYALALVAFGCAMLSKTVAATLPCALLLIVWWQRGRIEWRDVIPLVPFLVLGASLAALTLWLEKFHVGAVGAVWDLSFVERCLIAGRAAWFYAWKLTWPAELMFVYPQWSIDASDPFQYLWPASALGIVALLFALRHRWGRGPVTAVLYFGGTLIPALGFFDVYFMLYSYVADHFQYLASLGLITLAAATAVQASRSLAREGTAPVGALVRGGIGVALCLVVLLLAARTRSQTHVYHDSESLWRNAVHHNPEAWMAHNNLGSVLLRRGDVDESLVHFQRAVALHPGDAESINNLAAAHHARGRVDRAIALYRESLAADPSYGAARQNLARALASYEAVAPDDPRLAPAYEALGIAHAAQGQAPLARAAFQRALVLRPDLLPARLRLAALDATTGRLEAAAAEYRRVIAAAPRNAQARHGLCDVYARLQRLEEARTHCRRAEELGHPIPQPLRDVVEETRP